MVRQTAWRSSQMQSRVCYTQFRPPGEIIGAPQAAPLAPPDDPESGKINFCAVRVTIGGIEWLYLHHAGHRRALWTHGEDGWTGTWLAP